MSALTSGQQRFAQVFAAETGLDPKVIGAWLLAEQSGSAAQFYQRKGYNNWLNIANTDSGPAGGAHSSVWRNPDSAAKASAEWMRGQGQIAKEYGSPASGIKAILGSAGQVPHRQIQAIARSGWASSGYHGGADLSNLLGQVGDLQPIARSASTPRLPVAQTAPQREQQQAQVDPERVQAMQTIAGLFPGNKAGDVLLREALEKAGEEKQFTSSSIIKTPTGTFHTPASEGYVHPLPGAQVGREDMGVDLSAKPGSPVRAIGNSKVLGIHPDWYKGQPYVEMEFLDGPRKGQTWYAAEQITPHVRPGQLVRAGHAIGYVAEQGTGLEFGFGGGGGRTRAQVTGNTGDASHEHAPAGREFGQFLRGLR